MGLSISDAIRLLMLRIVDERRLPFEVKAPNATTRKAMAEGAKAAPRRRKDLDLLVSTVPQIRTLLLDWD